MVISQDLVHVNIMLSPWLTIGIRKFKCFTIISIYEILFFVRSLDKVEVDVEAMDKAGNFIGWLFVDNTNLSISLVEVKLQINDTCVFLVS